MTLRTKILFHLVVIHVLLGTVAVLALREHRPWLLAAEALFAVSAVVGFFLIREFFVPLELIRTGAELMRERDFTSHFREVGQPEMDQLIGVFNKMVDQLREERLRLQEQFVLFDRILTASPSGLITLDFDGRVELANPAAAALVQQPGDELLGRRLEEIGGPAAAAAATVGTGQSSVLPLQDGRRLRCSRVGFLDRGFERSFLVFEELTEELRASERQAYGKLIRMMSHEVNNSVGAVRSLLDSCKNYRMRLPEDERGDYEVALDVATRRLDHLNHFTNGFANVVRLPAPDPQPCDVEKLVRDVVTLMRPDLERRGIDCSVDAPGDLPAVSLDKNQLEHVLVNVLKNAYESIGDGGGTIRIELGQDTRPFVAVRDSGAGIPEDARAGLFTPFYSTKRDGRGLGLTVIQEILSRHGFEYSLCDLGGAGAEFRIRF